MNLNFDGNAHFENVPPPYAGTFKDQTATTKLKLPDTFGFGVAVRPIPELVIDLDLATLEVHAAVGRGTRVRVELPLTPPSAQNHPSG